jgi:methylphosphotriester-DNA--protein-cysteine methyltransferase
MESFKTFSTGIERANSTVDSLFELAAGIARAQAEGVRASKRADQDIAGATDHAIICKLGDALQEARHELERLALDVPPSARTGRVIERADAAIAFAYTEGGSRVFG